MEVKITKKQMKKMIIEHYRKLDCFDLTVKVYTEKKNVNLLARDYENNCNDSCYAKNTIMIFGKIYNNDAVHNFSEELSSEELESIVRENFDCEKFTISNVNFDNGGRISLFCSGNAPYCRGLIVTVDRIKKKAGKYIVKK